MQQVNTLVGSHNGGQGPTPILAWAISKSGGLVMASITLCERFKVPGTARAPGFFVVAKVLLHFHWASLQRC